MHQDLIRAKTGLPLDFEWLEARNKGCCQTNENSHRIAGAALIYALNSWRHSVRAAVRLILKLSRE